MRGAVNGVPLSCSAYRPSGARWGEFCPSGRAPATASVANSFPKPDWYFAGMARDCIETERAEERGFGGRTAVPCRFFSTREDKLHRMTFFVLESRFDPSKDLFSPPKT